MTTVRQLHIRSSSHEYAIFVGEGLIDRLGDYVDDNKSFDPERHHVIVTEPRVGSLYLDRLKHALERTGRKTDTIFVTADEAHKTIEEVTSLCQKILACGVRRDGVIWALGGGVLGDMAGFAAAITLRGLHYVQLPTTLLAQVDSSVGGKTGVNTEQGKNLIGAFYPPRLVLADTGVLISLPEQQRRAGYAELVKHAVIEDAGFFSDLENGEAEAMWDSSGAILTKNVYRSVSIKAKIVSDDEREAGRRQILNFGHTFGHALERLCGFDGTTLPHGYAVSIGMTMAANLSVRLGLCAHDVTLRLTRHLSKAGLPTTPHSVGQGISVDAMLEAMTFDKKRGSSGTNFITLRAIGDATITTISDMMPVREILETSLANPV